MHRLQVQLTAAQERALREMAQIRGCSISALIREGVDYLLEPRRLSRAEAIERANAVIGSFSSGLSDVSARHDHYLAEAYAGLDEAGHT